VKLVKEVEVTVIITATFAANLPANNKVNASIILDPALPTVSQLTIPMKEAWVVQDLFVSASQTPDAILEFFKNLTEGLFRSAPVNGLIVTNAARPIPAPVTYEGADIMTIVAQNLAAIGASAQTVTAYAKIRRFIA